jgi:hypothetical protein
MTSMARKIASQSCVVLAVVIAALVSAPTAVPAASPFEAFEAQGPFIISLGEGIKPAGVSGRFVVPSRRVFGFLSGSVVTPFMIEFTTNVPIATQAGNVHGQLLICEQPSLLAPSLAFFGCLNQFSTEFASFLGGDVTALDRAPVLETAVTWAGRVHLVSSVGAGDDELHPRLNVSGVFAFTGPITEGNGDVEGYLTLVLDTQGHIVGIATDLNGVPLSRLTFTGKWRP